MIELLHLKVTVITFDIGLIVVKDANPIHLDLTRDNKKAQSDPSHYAHSEMSRRMRHSTLIELTTIKKDIIIYNTMKRSEKKS